jgi:hypothetical protein
VERVEPVLGGNTMPALPRAGMPQRAVTADIGTLAELRRYGPAMLRALPFQTIGDIGWHGLETPRLLPELLQHATAGRP